MSTQELERSILIVSYYFPPLAVGASTRAAQIATLLAEREWNVHVLHAAPSNAVPSEWSWSAELESYGIERTVVEPVSVPSLVRHSLVRIRLASALGSAFRSECDSYGRWKERVLIEAERLARRRPFNLVLGLAPPLSIASTAEAVARQLNVPLAIDLGEPIELLAYRAPSYGGRSHESTLEFILGKAFYTTVPSRREKELLLRRYPILTHEEVGILPHRIQLHSENDEQQQKRTILFVAEEFASAHLRPLLSVLRTQNELQFIIAGRAPRSLGKLITSWQLEGRVLHDATITPSKLDRWIELSAAAVVLATRWSTTPRSIVDRIVGAGLPLLVLGEFAPILVADVPKGNVLVATKTTPSATRKEIAALLALPRSVPYTQDDSYEREFSRRLGMVMKL